MDQAGRYRQNFRLFGGFRSFQQGGAFPDASWVERSRLEALTAEQRRRFLPLCPDFVVELRSPSDNLEVLLGKMREYLDNGAKLGWLIDPENRRVYVYRPESPVRELEAPEVLSGDPVLLRVGPTRDLVVVAANIPA